MRKAVWLNAEHIRALPVEELSRDLEPFFEQAGFIPRREKVKPSRRLFASASSC